MSEELVALYDDAGQPCGSAPRSRMRRENLRHAATTVVVTNRTGLVYVHRRTDTKDVFPGMHDFACGGVIAAGEEPLGAALRELAEELGIVGVSLTDLGPADYADAHTNYRSFRYEVEWDGPISWQPEEVAWGDWWRPEDILGKLEEPGWCVPDTAALMHDWLIQRVALREAGGRVGDSRA